MANTPETTLRDGNIKATIWKNFGDNGNFFSVTLTRTYKDESGNYHDSNSFTGSELLRAAHLANRAYDTVSDLRQREAS